MITRYIFLLLILFCGFRSFAQQPVDTAFKKLDSLSKKADSTGYQINNTKERAYNNVTKLSARDYFILLGSNIKQEFTKPFHMTGKDFKKFGIFAGGLLLASFADEPVQQEALKLRMNNNSFRRTGNFLSKFGGPYEAYTLAGFGVYGLIFKNEKVKNTTLLATQAYITGSLAESLLKTLTGRTRPDYYNQIIEAEPKFTGPFGNTSANAAGKRSNSSFPSGHTTVAYAAATVFAKEYSTRPAVPIIAYGAASLIALSRITENRHWTTDILAGAMLGYLTGRQVVNNYHRFAKLKLSAAKKKAALTLSLHYNFGKMMPALVYKF